MKKLFLTSGLVLCMTCQAYATDITYSNNQYGSSACTYPYLDSYETSASLEAMWDPNPYTITLNSNTGSGATNYGSTAASPSSLYAIFGDAVYLESAHTNAMSISANGLTAAPNGALPTGKTYTLTLSPNLPTGHTTSEISGSTGYAASTNAQMEFKGFYSVAQDPQTNGATTNGTQYIDSTGKITPDGITAGTTTASNSTWYAQYVCQNASTYTPVLTGYTFNGWFTDPTNGTEVTNFCLTSNQTVHGHWTANSCTVTYNPTSHSTNSSAAAVTNTATYDSPYSVPSAAGRGTGLSAPATGYAFVGWTTDSSPVVTRTGTTTGTVDNAWTWTDTNNWTNTTCPTLYAAYIAKQNSITYNYGAHAKAGSTNLANYTDTTLATYDATYTVLDYNTSPISLHMQAADGYTFRGWSRDPNPTVTQNGNNYTVSNPFTTATWSGTSDLTVYAAYSANAYTISYNCGAPISGSDSVVNTQTNPAGTVPTTQNINMGGTYNLAANTCTLPGYGFAGWDCKVTGTSTALSGTPTVSYTDYSGTQSTIFAAEATGTFTNAANITCTAKWTPNHITLNWNKNGADSADISPTACDYDGAITLPPAPTRQGYTFSGWTVSNNP